METTTSRQRLTWDTLPAYMIDEGDVILVPGTDRYKKVYRIEDLGTRYEVNEYGQTEHVFQLKFHYNAPPRSGLLGYFTTDYHTPIKCGKGPRG